ncbi:DUF4178 domain-containing protein [Chitinimonas sp. BJB300]|uniref:DUF4178 domain-containing protein n=1 Tax=Chitinimonas sp. BJB300 TaxID=1559339 RepID=UPI000C0E8E6D|nr:DUF4178 domain-containing protein [Chitinimonas sp. BJB300]PHV12648.1 hypothetical protein CSQ89_04635 [Chitinimonas sp. BJB300]TSJ91182.1 DUF4178 domain-containing protein [Chitinimonas sp. BJB300]
MYAAPCPSCGAQVEFHSAASVMAVCGHCRSTLVRRDVDLDNLGKMAVLAEDRSPFKMRWRGRYGNAGFELIGRLQLRYAEGFWNEWYARFDDGRLGWLSEGSGLCYVTFERALKTTLPSVDDFQVGMQAKLDGQAYTVTNIENAECVAAEGELPFKPTPGNATPSVDLRSEKGFASLDYSETPPRAYIGEALELADLLDKAAPNELVKPKRVAARNFKCTSCGAPLTARNGEIHAVGCHHCGAVIDPDSPELKILSKARAALEAPLIPIGATGKLQGKTYAILGFLRRSTKVEDIDYSWDEYLLHSDDAGYAWLTCSSGHWNFARPTVRQPEMESSSTRVTYMKRTYRHFEHSEAQVKQVVGEFNWQVKIGQHIKFDDYIAPPYLLSREQSKTEQTWTLAEYITAEKVALAFNPPKPLPEPEGIAPNQPSPYGESRLYYMAMAAFLLIAILLQMGFTMASKHKVIWQDEFTINAETFDTNKATYTSKPFQIPPGDRNLVIHQSSNLDNRWFYADLALTNTKTGETIRLGREVSYYHGVDSDGSWYEGNNGDEAMLNDVPGGEYLLEMEIEADPQPQPLVNRVALIQDVPVWSNFWILLVVILIIPLFCWLRSNSFETERWADSDHPKGE